jgi:gas vesicle protein
MADGYDRFENEGNGGGSFVMGLLTGTVLGAGLGMLFAPRAGSELRNQISEQAGTLANQASEGVRKVTDSAGEWADRGRDMYGKAREAVVKGADEAQRYARNTANTARDAAAKGVDEAQTYVRDTANSMRDVAAKAAGASGGGSSYGSGADVRGTGAEQTRGQADTNPSSGLPGGSRRS